MSGHNKWSSIKHRKGAQDAKKGKIFTKLIKEITISTRLDGPDPDSNPRLRTAILAAKSENMPKDNIERAIKKGSGSLEGIEYENNIYEGYGPGGSAVLVETLTDNKNRTVAEVRHIFNKYGGSLGESGCVNWLFVKKGYITISNSNISEETIMEIALESGAEDVNNYKKTFEIITDLENFEKVKKEIIKASLSYEIAEIRNIPKNKSVLTEEHKEKLIKMISSLEESDDVTNIYTNTEIDY